jgi:multiple sugar transport system substrate-binding protein
MRETQFRVSRRAFLRLSAFSITGAALVACAAPAPQATTGSTGSDAPAQEATTLRIHIPTGPYADFTQTRADSFHEENPDVTVTVEAIPGAEFHTKARAMFATQQLGDICWMHNVTGQMQDLLHRDVFIAIDDFIEAEDFDVDAYLPTVIDTMTFEDHLMGLCFHAHPGNGHFYVNLDMFEEAGIEPDFDSQTFDELVEAMLALTIRNGDEVERWGWGAGLWYQPIECTARAFGGEIISADGTNSQVDSDETRQAIQFEYDMMYKHGVAPTLDQVQDTVQAMWLGGKVATWRVGMHTVPSTKLEVGDRFQWTVSPLPPGPNGTRGHDTTVHLLFITTLSEQAEAAWPFLKYMTNHEAGVQKVLQGAGAPGGRYDCVEDPELLEFLPQWASVARAFKDADPPHDAANRRTLEATQSVGNNLQNLWLNEIGVEEAVTKTHTELQAILEKPAEI